MAVDLDTVDTLAHSTRSNLTNSTHLLLFNWVRVLQYRVQSRLGRNAVLYPRGNLGRVAVLSGMIEVA